MMDKCCPNCTLIEDLRGVEFEDDVANITLNPEFDGNITISYGSIMMNYKTFEGVKYVEWDFVAKDWRDSQKEHE